MTPDQQRKTANLVRFIDRYATHLADCASNTEQTAEYCTCGYGDVAKAYQEVLRLLSEVSQ